jgi:hypothetical protein
MPITNDIEAYIAKQRQRLSAQRKNASYQTLYDISEP